MAGEISNYGQLVATVASYLYDRKDLAPIAPTFVRLSEQRIYRLLRVPANEAVLTVEEQTTDRVTIPFDFLESKVMVYDGRVLERISDQEYLTLQHKSSAPGAPKQFARLVREFVLYPAPDRTAKFSMVYWRDLSGQLVNDYDTNDVLRIAPNLYVYGALLEATPYLAQDERIKVWNDLFDQALAQIKEQAWNAEYAGSTVNVAPAYRDGRYPPYGRP